MQAVTRLFSVYVTFISVSIYRFFPAFFSRGFARGRKCFSSPSRVVTTHSKSLTVTFYLVSENTDKTPKANIELILTLAGLGRGTITFPESADHLEVKYSLFCCFSICHLKGLVFVLKSYSVFFLCIDFRTF